MGSKLARVCAVLALVMISSCLVRVNAGLAANRKLLEDSHSSKQKSNYNPDEVYDVGDQPFDVGIFESGDDHQSSSNTSTRGDKPNNHHYIPRQDFNNYDDPSNGSDGSG